MLPQLVFCPSNTGQDASHLEPPREIEDGTIWRAEGSLLKEQSEARHAAVNMQLDTCHIGRLVRKQVQCSLCNVGGFADPL
jgi:hypothetical protein